MGRLALGGFSFYYKRKNAAMDDYLKSSTPTFILEPKIYVFLMGYILFSTLNNLSVVLIKRTDLEIPCVLLAIMLSLSIYYLYREKRDKKIKQRINEYVDANQYEKITEYINSYIRLQPRIGWLRVERLMLFLLQGSISDYEIYLSQLKKLNILNDKDLKKVMELNNIILYLKGEEICDLVTEQGAILCFQKVNYILQRRGKLGHQDIIKLVQEVYNSSCMFYQFLGAVLLRETYHRIGDVQNARRYMVEAFERSPSDEITQLLKNI